MGRFVIGERGLVAALCLALVAAVAFAFWPGLAGDWLNWDDRVSFVENMAYRGLSWETVSWAWTTFAMGVYQPVAWMLLGGQYLAFGMNPWGYHLASLLMHAAVTVVLFLVCIAAGTRARPDEDAGSRRRRILVTALATAVVMVHPLRVEVVSWISCQPYLPCAFFYLLALWAYLRAHPAQGAFRPGWLAVSLVMFACALLNKAPAVSLPAVLLIFDIWLLGRLPGAPWTWWRQGSRAVLAEKLVFAAVALPFVVAAIAARMSVAPPEMVDSSRLWAGPLQIAEALWFYPFKTVLPVYLSPYYSVASPTRGTGMMRAIAPWATLLVAIPLLLRLRSPASGIVLAYIATLSPNIGLIKLTTQATADRYVFIPSLVVLVMVCAVRWQGILPPWPRMLRAMRIGALATALLAVPGLAVASRAYATVWQDSITFWEYAIRQGAGRAPTVASGLGQAYLLAGRHADAVRMFATTVALRPRSAQAHHNLGLALMQARRMEEAEGHLRMAASINPRLPNLMFDLGQLYWLQEKNKPALVALALAVSIDPRNGPARELVVELLMTTPDLDPQLVASVREVLARR